MTYAINVPIPPYSRFLPTLTEDEMKNLSLEIAQKAAGAVAQTWPCYIGNMVELLPQNMGESIRPLRKGYLPDSLERRILWLATLAWDKKKYTDFLERVPNSRIVERCDFPQPLVFEEERIIGKKNCFDEVFKGESHYLNSIKTVKQYEQIRTDAFGRRGTVLPLLEKMGYREVEKPSKGDVILYFSNIQKPLAGDFPYYSNEDKPTHYGRVDEITSTGEIFVISKFDDSHIYRHRIDSVPYLYGNKFSFFAKNR